MIYQKKNSHEEKPPRENKEYKDHKDHKEHKEHREYKGSGGSYVVYTEKKKEDKEQPPKEATPVNYQKSKSDVGKEDPNKVIEFEG